MTATAQQFVVRRADDDRIIETSYAFAAEVWNSSLEPEDGIIDIVRIDGTWQIVSDWRMTVDRQVVAVYADLERK